MEMETNMPAQRTSFWKLIEQEAIQIPNYQREYAQGRENRRAKLIREGFVRSLYDAIQNGCPLELDFIFGGRETGEVPDTFRPVDGQQRLTILFLLHWYIFMRAGKTDDLTKLGRKFSYATRTTSEVFCKKVADGSLPICFVPDKGDGISAQIRDLPWFTGAMSSDPTVRSMLTVIDCIHKQFADMCDYTEAAEKLVSDDCPISFFFLDWNHAFGTSSGVRDLYIKMNARGVQLTDFELFKANLQKKDDGNNRFDLLAKYLRDEDTASERVKIIGKFNNEYTNFFFNLIDEGKIIRSDDHSSKCQMFDISMMNFINEVFRMNYFCTISRLGINAKKYRADNDVFRQMRGKEFSAFIDTRGEMLNDTRGEMLHCKYWKSEQDHLAAIPEIEKTLVASFDNIVKLLDAMSKSGIGLKTDEKPCRYSLGEIMRRYAVDPLSNHALPAKDSLIRMALYAFLLRFGIPESGEQKSAFSEWSRFVWKIDKNSEFKNFDEVVDTLRGYRTILETCKDCSAESVTSAIANFGNESSAKLGAPAQLQLEEEKIKANLIISDKGYAWEEAIREAEDYYSDCGQIWFLLDLSKKKESDGYDYDRFRRAFRLSKRIFDSYRQVKKADYKLFERALLAVKSAGTKDHLLSMGISTPNTKRFVGDKFAAHISHQYCESKDDKDRDKYSITLDLLQEMTESNEVADVNRWLHDYIDAGSSSVDWKEIFIRYPLQDANVKGLSSKNGFEPAAWEDNRQYTAVYTNEKKRTECGELHSFLLAWRLSEAGIDVHYHTDSNDQYMENGFPNRYFEIKETEIGYMDGAFCERDRNGTINSLGDDDEAFHTLKQQFSQPQV